MLAVIRLIDAAVQFAIQRNHWKISLSLSLSVSHIQLSFSRIITTSRKVEGENLDRPPSHLIINIYEDIWIMGFCHNKISFGGRKSREREGEEGQRAEEEDSARVLVWSSGADEGDAVWCEDDFSLHGDALWKLSPSDLPWQSMCASSSSTLLFSSQILRTVWTF